MNASPTMLLADVASSLLVVIDAQARLTQVMSGRSTLVRNCKILITSAKALDVPMIITAQYPKGLGQTEQDLLDCAPEDVPLVEKTCFSCFGSDGFKKRIADSKKTQVILCGIETHVCVLQTAMDLISNNKQVFVVSDAVDSRSKSNKQFALQRISNAGGIITVTESVLFEWLKDAKHEHFKALTALIR